MSERLLSAYPDSSRSEGILFDELISPWWRRAAILFGTATIFIGAYDLAMRVDTSSVAPETIFAAFAPLGTFELKKIAAEPAPSMLQATTTPLKPARIQIPVIQMDATVEAVGLKADRQTMAAPKAFLNVGWYEPGVKPGEEGNAVFAGHLNSPILGKNGAFKDLARVQAGDTVIIIDDVGRTLTYSVINDTVYTTEYAPREEIFSKTGPSQIALITCEGKWDPKKKTFDKRRVVVARLH